MIGQRKNRRSATHRSNHYNGNSDDYRDKNDKLINVKEEMFALLNDPEVSKDAKLQALSTFYLGQHLLKIGTSMKTMVELEEQVC